MGALPNRKRRVNQTLVNDVFAGASAPADFSAEFEVRMNSPVDTLQPPGSKRGQWMALAAAFLGWMFDGFEMGLFPLVARPALKELLSGDSIEVDRWYAIITEAFLIGAATGGVLFGWLGDRIGRVRAMTLSVLTYTLVMGCCGFATTPLQMFVLRFIAALGMGGEWSLGVSLVMEIWPNKSRGVVAGLIGAASNVGFLLIALIGLVLGQVTASLQTWLTEAGLSERTIAYLMNHDGWRMMMIIGAAPALLTFLIRLFVPESQKWLHAKETGATSAWATRDLLAVMVGALGPLGMVYFYRSDTPWWQELPITLIGTVVALVGFSYPVFKFLQRTSDAESNPVHKLGPTMRRMMLAACLSGVALVGTWGAIQLAVPWVAKIAGQEAAEMRMSDDEAALYRRTAASMTQIYAAAGAIIGCMAGGMLGHSIGRRPTYFLLCLTSLASALWFFLSNDRYGHHLLLTVALAGATTASFYGWLPLYLPELFKTSARATGQGFAFNFGRIIAAVGALQTANLIAHFQSDTVVGGVTFRAGHPTACSIICLVYVVGMVLIWLAPETRGQPLPE